MFLEKLKIVYTKLCVRKKIIMLRVKSKLPIIVFVCTPIHGNLGDQAIVYAQYKFFESIGFGKRILELSDPDYHRVKKTLSKYINTKDVIVIDGGGNIGSLWPREDQIIREVIETFSHNRIIIFPQTSYYLDDDKSAELKEKMREAFNKTDTAAICFCRDEASFCTITNEFKVRSFFVPDIVMSLNGIKIKQEEKRGVAICLRDDLESANIDDGRKELLNYLEEKNIPCIYLSTVKDLICRGNKNREKILYQAWSEFSHAELIITDRLHGMIFAAILGIPCIAFDNLSHKVQNGYFWLTELPYIQISKDKCDAINYFISLYKKANNFSYDNHAMDNKIRIMKEVVAQEISDNEIK